VEILVLPVAFLGAFVGFAFWMQHRLKDQGYRPGQTAPSRAVHHSFDPLTSMRVRGGSRVGRWNATYPVVTLSADPEWAHLSGLVPVWISRAEVVSVRPIRSALGQGIRFDTADGVLDGVIFWTFDGPGVLQGFARLGWPVSGP
jgi:hypothetical protein